MEDYEFVALPDATKAHLMLMWAYAAKHKNRFPDDPKFLKNKMGLQQPPDIKGLVKSGFISYETVQDSAKNYTADHETVPREEKIREEKIREEERREDKASNPLEPYTLLTECLPKFSEWMEKAHGKPYPIRDKDKKTLRLLITQDGFKEQEIIDVLEWVWTKEPQGDGFTCRAQIKSISGIRRKWNNDETAFRNCYDQMNQWNGKNQGQYTGSEELPF
jgi:hypothetical protein